MRRRWLSLAESDGSERMRHNWLRPLVWWGAIGFSGWVWWNWGRGLIQVLLALGFIWLLGKMAD